MANVLKIDERDTVAVALEPLEAGSVHAGVVLRERIERGHKFALRPFEAGEVVTKYGATIGLAKAPIAAGEHIHTHNLRTSLGGVDEYAYTGAPPAEMDVAAAPTIQAFERANGEIGIRNDLWIIPLVGCINGLAQSIARRFQATAELPEGSSVQVLAHPYGCSQLGDDLSATRAILRNFAIHPNAGGVLVLGLGCENNTLAYFREGLSVPDPSRIRFMAAQDMEDETESALAHLSDLAARMQADRRVPVSAARLRVGLKCGGSDGFSGISANPLLGRFSDWLCEVGGSSVLTEVPEMFGAERILMARAQDEATFQRIVSLINDFKQYYIDHRQPIFENPSPGNKDGGISTLEEKSLGCTQKAGTAPVRDVLRYGERVRTPGLSLLEAPGNDGVSVTALSAAGCHMVLFTTGRGTPFGGAVPTVKVASNDDLATRKKHWIDFNAGPIAAGAQSLDSARDAFVKKILAIASGEPTRNEVNGMHEIVIFKSGVTL